MFRFFSPTPAEQAAQVLVGVGVAAVGVGVVAYGIASVNAASEPARARAAVDARLAAALAAAEAESAAVRARKLTLDANAGVRALSAPKGNKEAESALAKLVAAADASEKEADALCDEAGKARLAARAHLAALVAPSALAALV